jgi:hypothetical protein
MVQLSLINSHTVELHPLCNPFKQSIIYVKKKKRGRNKPIRVINLQIQIDNLEAHRAY